MSSNVVREKYRSIAYLDQLPVWNGVTPFGLDVPEKLLSAFNNPQDSYPTIHVAGTNGKGTVSTFLSTIFYKTGLKVGQFISPHLTDINERCLIDGKPVSFELLDEALSRVIRKSKDLALQPSYFEFITVASFLIFKEENIELAVIEAGMGGRLDATNTISRPLATVITSVGYDHCQFLGNTLAKIAHEKALIAKPKTPMFVGIVDEEARQAISKVTDKLGIQTFYSKQCEFEEFLNEKNVSGVFLKSIEFWPEYKKDNACLAFKIAEFLEVGIPQILNGLISAKWPGRAELIKFEGIDILLECAHNPQGMEAGLAYVDKLISEFHYASVTFLVGFLKQKNWKEMVRQIKIFFEKYPNLKSKIVFTQSGHQQAENIQTLRAEFPGSFANSDSKSALAEIISEALPKEDQLIVIIGSIYLVGEVRGQLIREDFSTL
jgi:dihydrofolate synthase / folylpolyglutamate synthase